MFAHDVLEWVRWIQRHDSSIGADWWRQFGRIRVKGSLQCPKHVRHLIHRAVHDQQDADIHIVFQTEKFFASDMHHLFEWVLFGWLRHVHRYYDSWLRTSSERIGVGCVWYQVFHLRPCWHTGISRYVRRNFSCARSIAMTHFAISPAAI